jgi:hypothetical protein
MHRKKLIESNARPHCCMCAVRVSNGRVAWNALLLRKKTAYVFRSTCTSSVLRLALAAGLVLLPGAPVRAWHGMCHILYSTGHRASFPVVRHHEINRIYRDTVNSLISSLGKRKERKLVCITKLQLQ